MAKQVFLKGAKLYDKFLSGFLSYSGLRVIGREDILHIDLDGHEYYIYLKCVSHKGNPYPLNDQRAQLPKRPIFDTVKQSNIDFLFLGYDMDNDVFVCWNPLKVRQRLNVKEYVSFYSFKDVQSNVQPGKVDVAELSNGDKLVVFKREDMLAFFDMIKVHFPILKERDIISGDDEENAVVITPVSQNKKLEVVGVLSDVSADTAVKLLIDSMVVQDNSRLDIIRECMNNFAKFYYKMKLSDWKRLVYNYLGD